MRARFSLSAVNEKCRVKNAHFVVLRAQVEVYSSDCWYGLRVATTLTECLTEEAHTIMCCLPAWRRACVCVQPVIEPNMYFYFYTCTWCMHASTSLNSMCTIAIAMRCEHKFYSIFFGTSVECLFHFARRASQLEFIFAIRCAELQFCICRMQIRFRVGFASTEKLKRQFLLQSPCENQNKLHHVVNLISTKMNGFLLLVAVAEIVDTNSRAESKNCIFDADNRPTCRPIVEHGDNKICNVEIKQNKCEHGTSAHTYLAQFLAFVVR